MILNKLTNRLTKIIEFPFLVLRMQLRQNECKKLKDNILLARLIYNAPKCYDRDFEYPWMLKNIEIKEGKLLDIGSTIGDMLYDLLPKEISIYILNINEQKTSDKIEKVQGDIRATEFEDNTFDCITCISTLEHIGVGGRYGVEDDKEGDLKAMKEMRRILKPGGKLLLTVPYGRSDVLPINRLYNLKKIENLTKGFQIKNQIFRKYNKKYGIWLYVSEEEASRTDWKVERWYSIAMYILEKL